MFRSEFVSSVADEAAHHHADILDSVDKMDETQLEVIKAILGCFKCPCRHHCHSFQEFVERPQILASYLPATRSLSLSADE